MEVHFAPDVEQKLNELAGRAGLSADELVKDAVAGYISGLAEVRTVLDARYDDLKSGRVEPVDGEAFFEQLRGRERKALNDKAS